MPSTLEGCKKYFKSNDLYKIFGLKRDCLQTDIKKAYYKLSLKVHPDRVPQDQKKIATEKFKVLTKLYQVLVDSKKKALYDEKGIIDEEDGETLLPQWLISWSNLFAPITTQDIDIFKSRYLNSELEKHDIKSSYLSGKGCINYMMDFIPFMDVANEPRIKNIVHEMINSKEVPAYETFTNEPLSKRNRRHKKCAKEAKEIENQQILERQSNGIAAFNWIEKITEKYGTSSDDSDPDFIPSGRKKNNKRKQTTEPEVTPKKSPKMSPQKSPKNRTKN